MHNPFPYASICMRALNQARKGLSRSAKAALLDLICETWECGALPDDDRILADAAEVDRRTWPKIRAALESLSEVRDGAWSLTIVEKARAHAEQRCRHRCKPQSNKTNDLPPPIRNKPIEPEGGSIGSARERAHRPTPPSRDFENGGEKKERRAANPSATRRQSHPRHRLTPIDTSWSPTPADISFAQQRGYDDLWIERQAVLFGNHHLARGSRFADWAAAWCCWVDRAHQFRRPNRDAERNEQQQSYAASIFRAAMSRRGAGDRRWS